MGSVWLRWVGFLLVATMLAGCGAQAGTSSTTGADRVATRESFKVKAAGGSVQIRAYADAESTR